MQTKFCTHRNITFCKQDSLLVKGWRGHAIKPLWLWHLTLCGGSSCFFNTFTFCCSSRLVYYHHITEIIAVTDFVFKWIHRFLVIFSEVRLNRLTNKPTWARVSLLCSDRLVSVDSLIIFLRWNFFMLCGLDQRVKLQFKSLKKKSSQTGTKWSYA